MTTTAHASTADQEPEVLEPPAAPPETIDTSTPEPTPAANTAPESLPPCPFAEEVILSACGDLVEYLSQREQTFATEEAIAAHLARTSPPEVYPYVMERMRDSVSVNYMGTVGTSIGDAPLQQGVAHGVTLTANGWHFLMGRRQSVAELRERRLRDELLAHKARVQAEHELAGEVQACQADVEGAKEEFAAAKMRLSAANEKLANFVRGAVQTTFIDKSGTQSAPTGEVTGFERGYAAFDPDKAMAVNPYPADPQRSKWNYGYAKAATDYEAAEAAKAPQLPDWALRTGADELPRTEAAKWGKTSADLSGMILEEAARAELRRGEDKLSVVDSVVTIFDRPYLVMDESDDRDLFLALPLYDRDDFQQLHEATFGRVVDSVDQSDEAKAMRQAGGEFCGRAVKIGRKKFYVGPLKDALVVTADAPDDVLPVVVVGADEPGEKGHDDEDGDDAHGLNNGD